MQDPWARNNEVVATFFEKWREGKHFQNLGESVVTVRAVATFG
jgi:hypothetical protein